MKDIVEFSIYSFLYHSKYVFCPEAMYSFAKASVYWATCLFMKLRMLLLIKYAILLNTLKLLCGKFLECE